jgi:protein-S-isoprenylcysteine O-methyltransferase Ste14
MSAGAGNGLLRSARKHGVAGSLRVVAAWALVVGLVAVARPSPLSLALGLPLLALGEAWRVWAAGHLLKTRELAVSGPYRHVRNPLYLGRLCILTGCGLAARLPVTVGGLEVPAHLGVLALGLAAFFGYYLPRKRRVEGERLRALHGESWKTWSRHVPEIVPRLTPYGGNVRRWSAARFRANGEAAMAGAVAALGLALVWRAGLLGA